MFDRSPHAGKALEVHEGGNVLRRSIPARGGKGSTWVHSEGLDDQEFWSEMVGKDVRG